MNCEAIVAEMEVLEGLEASGNITTAQRERLAELFGMLDAAFERENSGIAAAIRAIKPG